MNIDNANITEKIDFIEHILDYYDWDSTELSDVTYEVNRVKKKVNDDNLYLTVVGEFSGGKSTFINALLRDNLLESNVVQGTTISNTIIRYAPQYNLIVKSDNKEIINLSKKLRFMAVVLFFKRLFDRNRSSATTKRDILKKYISDVTTTEKYGNGIEVIIEHPAEILKNGIVIIDTPGTNSIDRWHEDITKEAIRDISDASLILLNGSKPLEKTFLNFIKENLSDVLSHSIFVMSKMDMLRERERERQIQYVKQNIRQNFDIENPVVLPYTPLFVLGEAVPEVRAEYDYDKSDYTTLISDSYTSEERIISYIREHKTQIQYEKIESILKQISTELSDKMNLMKTEYQKKHKVLMAHTRRSIKDFADEMRDKYLGAYKEKSESTVNQITKQIDIIHQEQMAQITQEFSECSSREAVEDFCKNTLPKKLEIKIRELANSILSESKKLTQTEQEVLSGFWNDFEKTYNELKSLEIKKLNRSFYKEKRLTLANSTEFISAGQELHKMNDNAKLFHGGGAAIGAVIGSLFLPGVGTGVGAALGGFLGDLFSPSLESVKEKAWKQVAPSIDKSYEDAISFISEKVDNYNTDIQNHIKQQIDNCIDEYGGLVDTLIAEDEEMKEETNKKICDLQKDIDWIKTKLIIEV